jgi:hypothetical protein
VDVQQLPVDVQQESPLAVCNTALLLLLLLLLRGMP